VNNIGLVAIGTIGTEQADSDVDNPLLTSVGCRAPYTAISAAVKTLSTIYVLGVS
jgi:hypothetical protein